MSICAVSGFMSTMRPVMVYSRRNSAAIPATAPVSPASAATELAAVPTAAPSPAVAGRMVAEATSRPTCTGWCRRASHSGRSSAAGRFIGLKLGVRHGDHLGDLRLHRRKGGKLGDHIERLHDQQAEVFLHDLSLCQPRTNLRSRFLRGAPERMIGHAVEWIAGLILGIAQK